MAKMTQAIPRKKKEQAKKKKNKKDDKEVLAKEADFLAKVRKIANSDTTGSSLDN